jgi:hypothetical protein
MSVKTLASSSIPSLDIQPGSVMRDLVTKPLLSCDEAGCSRRSRFCGEPISPGTGGPDRSTTSGRPWWPSTRPSSAPSAFYREPDRARGGQTTAGARAVVPRSMGELGRSGPRHNP